MYATKTFFKNESWTKDRAESEMRTSKQPSHPPSSKRQLKTNQVIAHKDCEINCLKRTQCKIITAENCSKKRHCSFGYFLFFHYFSPFSKDVHLFGFILHCQHFLLILVIGLNSLVHAFIQWPLNICHALNPKDTEMKVIWYLLFFVCLRGLSLFLWCWGLKLLGKCSTT